MLITGGKLHILRLKNEGLSVFPLTFNHVKHSTLSVSRDIILGNFKHWPFFTPLHTFLRSTNTNCSDLGESTNKLLSGSLIWRYREVTWHVHILSIPFVKHINNRGALLLGPPMFICLKGATEISLIGSRLTQRSKCCYSTPPCPASSVKARMFLHGTSVGDCIKGLVFISV